MTITASKISDGNRAEVLDFVRCKKSKGAFTVIDVGGGVFSWCSSYLDALVDMNPQHTQTSYPIFQGDINEIHVWNDIEAYTKQYGKFDFCICTHTLEDIRNPMFVCSQMERIAKGGYIAVPSKHVEMARFEFGPNGHRGYIHHRWIFEVKNNRFMGYPKLNVIEYMSELNQVASLDPNLCDLNFYWTDAIGLELVNNDYMGPNKEAVISYLLQLI